MPEAQIRAYKPGRFSFNVKGGRCETCKGAGVKVIEMNFLPDVHVECETCNGKRYNRETLEIRYKGKSISDVLDMNISDASKFFREHSKNSQNSEYFRISWTWIHKTWTAFHKPFSGGEAQRIKLSTELSKRSTGKTFYILDEPSTGLHFEDIRLLLEVLQRLVNEGNTVLVIEHNLDIVKVADYIIDIGPEGGKGGGDVFIPGNTRRFGENKKIKISYW